MKTQNHIPMMLSYSQQCYISKDPRCRTFIRLCTTTMTVYTFNSADNKLLYIDLVSTQHLTKLNMLFVHLHSLFILTVY